VEHFSDELWVDFVRQLPVPQGRDAIQQHLDTGCPQCTEAFRLWSSVAAMMSREHEYQVPDDAQRAVSAAFMNWRRLRVIPKQARIASLLFDSFREPLAAGVRSGTSCARRLLHQAGDWSIDLALEATAGQVLLEGQVLSASARQTAKDGVEVFAVASGALLSHAVINQFGEFQMKYEPKNDVSLYLDIPGETPVAIAIPA
jgi:hypothetical protein